MVENTANISTNLVTAPPRLTHLQRLELIGVHIDTDATTPEAAADRIIATMSATGLIT